MPVTVFSETRDAYDQMKRGERRSFSVSMKKASVKAEQKALKLNKRPPTAFALFVKENYHKVRDELKMINNEDVPHKMIMGRLSQLWKGTSEGAARGDRKEEDYSNEPAPQKSKSDVKQDADDSNLNSSQPRPDSGSVEVKKSTISSAGKGLFATKAFAKGEYVTSYKGDLLTKEQYDAMDPSNDYVLMVSKNKFIDAEKSTVQDARYCNMARSKDRPAVRNNVAFSYSTQRGAFIVALKAIKPGDELLVSYGRSYWPAKEKLKRHASLIATEETE